MQKSRSFNFRKMLEIPGKHIQSLIFDQGSSEDEDEDEEESPTNSDSKNECDHPLEIQPTGAVHFSPPPPVDGEAPKEEPPPRKPPSDMEMMKERFAKLLLGEDMSGAGNGVSSALALSNAITNLAASVFGEQSKLEPMSDERKARWRKEVDWLLSVTDHIVEFAPSKQVAKDGSTMEIMTTRQRLDLLMNIPALKKLDAMLLDTLDKFKENNEFWYGSKDANQSEGAQRMSDKWWLPIVKVPPNGLSDEARRRILSHKDNVNQVLKAAQAINAQTISEMEIPENYIDSLPKNGRESLGDFIYKCITVEYFNPEQFLSTMDFSTEHRVVDFKNKIEASVVIWKRKMVSKDAKSSWSSAVSLEKRELLEERAETLLLIIKQRFPGLPQSSLDISKIQYNKDVGKAILESYSRVIESSAFTVLSRIEDVLHADSLTRNPNLAVSSRRYSMDSLPLLEDRSKSPKQDMDSTDTTQMTLSDFMGWGGGDLKRTNSAGDLEDCLREMDDKSTNMGTPEKAGYWEKIGYLTALTNPNPIARN